MAHSSLRVFLLRSPDGGPSSDAAATAGDPYESLLTARLACTAVSIPTLAHVTVNVDVLVRILAERESEFWAVVVTSKRAVEALVEAWDRASKDDGAFTSTTAPLWRSKPLFTVGKATLRSSVPLGFSSPFSPEILPGNATLLAHAIVAHTPAPPVSKSILFLAGDKRLPTLPETLQSAGFKMEELEVYRTGPAPEFAEAIEKACASVEGEESGNVDGQEGGRVAGGGAGADPSAGEDRVRPGDPDWIVAFSPSGISVALSHPSTDIFARAKFACIGETTAAAVRKAEWTVGCVARKPTAEGVVEAMEVAMSGGGGGGGGGAAEL
ncbi:tetrapyrrole biosynthesis, uroporphyrinogen III synthase [Gonapodya prolifera JEL478]|uniref:Tetrapyrrole biosynthesis, uroporphyrinogen III synthase n=1 Tax=Gonapodya prolifera (strain JEL478) TaxID=1344416 RepID=A0A139AMJ6_GONPJ|nr:tetrapyrrole biosynthesis, uroporphyrinogen III synthase [Gonapodya prolifera JEL478]|eukprot:KXS17928.1 tetrapyrrole biosynthesis, uroporphyrinogen III synthase [Gonapodya prolifera JEL478]